jgi:hypothetical protein
MANMETLAARPDLAIPLLRTAALSFDRLRS